MQVQVEGQLAEARAACLSLQDSQARKKGSLVFRLIRGGLSILAAALALQQVWALLLQQVAPCMPAKVYSSCCLWQVVLCELHGRSSSLRGCLVIKCLR